MLAYFHVERDQRHFEDDMRTDHGVVGHVLQSLLADSWLDTPEQGQARSDAMIQLANAPDAPTRFQWVPGAASAEQQQADGHEFVSRFPVRVRGHDVGTLVVRESLDESDRLARSELAYTAISFAVVVLLCLVASLTLGGILVGKPIHKLVDKARRVGRRDFQGAVAVGGHDELAELADEMNAMSDALARALDQIATETEGRIRAVEQLRHAERLATVGRLAAGLAHELGTPLSIVGGHAQMIAVREVSGEAITASANAIEREAHRMGRIVRQLLDFARRKGPEGHSCDAGEVVRRSIALLAPMTEKHGVRPELDVPAEPVVAAIDEDSLQHVLTNLAVNAVQAMPAGGTLRVAVAHAADQLRIDVADSGTGIAKDVLPHVFEPFFTTKPPGEGTGLGLAVVYGIVDDHGGRIEVDSSERGTTFSVFLAEARP